MRGDVGMVERGERLRFALEAHQPIGIGPQTLGQDLQRDVAIELGIARAIHLAHAAFADERRDFVHTKACTGWDGQVCGLYGSRQSFRALIL